MCSALVFPGEKKTRSGITAWNLVADNRFQTNLRRVPRVSSLEANILVSYILLPDVSRHCSEFFVRDTSDIHAGEMF